MRKFILLLVLCSFSSFLANAQKQFSIGLTAGVSQHTGKTYKSEFKDPTGFYAGVTGNFDLPVGFSLQPSVLYVLKQARFTEVTEYQTNSIEVPVSLQWGPDLLLFRPFVDITPFVGLDMVKYNRIMNGDNVVQKNTHHHEDNSLPFEFGVGVGGGIDIWKLRIVARYNWNLDSLYKDDEFATIFGSKDNKFRGWSVGLSVFF